MSLVSKIRALSSNPAMLAAYSRWLAAKTLTGKSPRLQLPGGGSVGDWISFSEYWSFVQGAVSGPEQLFAERAFAKGTRGVAIDIGANVGVFTCMLASFARTVHAFEPIPETFCRLKKNVEFNGMLERVRLNCLAVGKENGLITFQIDDRSASTNRLAVAGEVAPRDDTRTQSIATVTLDRYCESLQIEFIDFLKIDVEGMEPYVLAGARSLLNERKVAAILIEICPANLRSIGLSPARLYREFESARYSPHALNEDGQAGTKLLLTEIEAMSLVNVVLLPNV